LSVAELEQSLFRIDDFTEYWNFCLIQAHLRQIFGSGFTLVKAVAAGWAVVFGHLEAILDFSKVAAFYALVLA